MKKILYIILFVTIPLFSQVKIDRDLGEFSKVAVYDGINLELIKSEVNKVEITGNNTKFVVVKNKNGDLKVRLNLEKRFSAKPEQPYSNTSSATQLCERIHRILGK